jgi:cytochrome bd-type quinol oxidase subunit 2
MAKLKDKVKTTLDEGRMLILGSQVLLGFQFRSALEKGFDKLPEHARYTKLGGLALMLLAVALLMWPGAYHQVVEDGEDTHDLHRFATAVMSIALLPFALGLAADFFVGAESLFGTARGLVAGALALCVALFFWYGLEALRRAGREPEVEEEKEMSKRRGEDEEGGTKLNDKIQQVLTEVRVVLPGAQALLGFQFAALLVEGFEKLPQASKYVHFVSLIFIALAIVLMMTPAAYHRMVERGENTEHFHRFASHALIAAMVPLALALCADLYVVAERVTRSAAAGATAAADHACPAGETTYHRTPNPRMPSPLAWPGLPSPVYV